MKNKYFFITIDTEADNQWDNNHKCTTFNSNYLPRFQELAEKYEFKPVWLTTFEMANDNEFVNYFKKKQDDNLCEIGMHLHAWNNPPEYNLTKKTNERSYLIEYPKNIMDEKIKELDALLTKKFRTKPISHRAGRWSMNNDYYELLEKNGYKIDCSITPHISWEKCLGESGVPGSNYIKEPDNCSFKGGILEVPVTIKKIRKISFKNERSGIKKILKKVYYFFKGKYQWVRPSSNYELNEIKNIIDICNKNNEYVMFMIHSSELMPGGSPNFTTEEDIEKLYMTIEEIFKYMSQLKYKGITLREYYEIIKGR